MFGFLSEAARRACGKPLPDKFVFYKCQVFGKDYILLGAVPEITLAGIDIKSKYKNNTQLKVVVTLEQVVAVEREYELQTGKCSRCLGTSEILDYIDINETKLMKQCYVCSGTGLSNISRFDGVKEPLKVDNVIVREHKKINHDDSLQSSKYSTRFSKKVLPKNKSKKEKLEDGRTVLYRRKR